MPKQFGSYLPKRQTFGFLLWLLSPIPASALALSFLILQFLYNAFLSFFSFFFFFLVRITFFWITVYKIGKKTEFVKWQRHWCCQRVLSLWRSVKLPLFHQNETNNNNKLQSSNTIALALSVSNKASCAVGRAPVISYSKDSIVRNFFFSSQLEFFHSSISPVVCIAEFLTGWEGEGRSCSRCL